MPGMSRPELVAHVWLAHPAVPTIFMSGYAGLTIERGKIPDGVTVPEQPISSERRDEAIRVAVSGTDRSA